MGHSTPEQKHSWYLRNKDRVRKKRQKWDKENPEKLRAQRQRYAKKHAKELYLAHKNHNDDLRFSAIANLGNVCVNCGITDVRVLTIDHVNNNGNVHRKKVSAVKLYRQLRDREVDMSDYQVLCWNCNYLKSNR